MNRNTIKRILVTIGVTAGFLTAHRRDEARPASARRRLTTAEPTLNRN